MNRDDIYGLINEERARQDEKWGHRHPIPNSIFLMVLTEEVGEVARAIHDDMFGGRGAGQLKDELIQVAAVAIQWLERSK
jgi:NTP pyrophosphatase (non-canonical NTP hydrolase)